MKGIRGVTKDYATPTTAGVAVAATKEQPKMVTEPLPILEPPTHAPENVEPLKPVIEEKEQGPALTKRFYKAQGFVITIDGEKELRIEIDTGKHPDAERWQSGDAIALKLGKTTLSALIVTDVESEAQEPPPTEPAPAAIEVIEEKKSDDETGKELPE